jgi:hypothetical protein
MGPNEIDHEMVMLIGLAIIWVVAAISWIMAFVEYREEKRR